jgi:hypothetical protein
MISKTQQNVDGEFLYRLSHPLGEYVLERGQGCSTPFANVTFDLANHPVRILALEGLKGKTGWLGLQRLIIDSFEREEHLLFSAFDEDGHSLDQETCEKLFYCGGMVNLGDQPFPVATERLAQEFERHAQATISRSLEENNKHFQEARAKLEKWADDMVLAVEKELKDTKQQIKLLNRQARVAAIVEEQHKLQEKIQSLEKKTRRQRQRIFDVEDAIAQKRDTLIAALERRMAQRTSNETLFTIRWQVV